MGKVAGCGKERKGTEGPRPGHRLLRACSAPRWRCGASKQRELPTLEARDPARPLVPLSIWAWSRSVPPRSPQSGPRQLPSVCFALPPSSVFFLTCCEVRKVLSEYHLTDAHQKPVRGAAFEVRTPRSLSQQLRQLEAGFKFRSAAPQSLCRRQCAIRCGSPRAASDSAWPSSQRLSWGPLSQSTPSPGENTMLCTEPRPEAGGSERGQVAVHGRQVGAVTHYSPRRAPR